MKSSLIYLLVIVLFVSCAPGGATDGSSVTYPVRFSTPSTTYDWVKYDVSIDGTSISFVIYDDDFTPYHDLSPGGYQISGTIQRSLVSHGVVLEDPQPYSRSFTVYEYGQNISL